MDYSTYPGRTTQWLQTQLPEQPLHSQDERSPQRNEPIGEVMLGASEDVSVQSPTLSSHFYVPYTFPTFANYPLNTYGSPQQQQGQWSIPVSSYSSLNGATTSQTTSQQQQQQQSPVQHIQSPVMQHTTPSTQPVAQQQSPQQQQQFHQTQMSPPQSHMTIDPTLMLSNFSQSTHSSPAFTPSTYYSFGSHMPTLTLNPNLLHAPTPTVASQGVGSSPTQTQPQQTQPQHIQPQTSYTSTITSGLGSGSSGASTSTLINVLNGLLSAKSLPSSPTQIVRPLIEIGAREVDLPMRLKILSKIRDNAGNDFYQSWASNVEAMDIIREWLKDAVTSKRADWDETVMPLLHVIDRLPLTVEALKASKVAKVVMKLKEVTTNSAVKDMASNLENRWRNLVSIAEKANTGKKVENKSIEDQRLKKRKLEETATSSKVAPPAKKIVIAKPTPTMVRPVAVKKEVKPTPPVKDAKSDSSFFSAPKPKPKLPSFKKAPVKREAALDPNVAQPSAVDPFKDALAAMTKARSSPTPTAQSESKATPPPTGSGAVTGKKRKKVSFKSEDRLVDIKYIEPAVYDDDVTNGIGLSHNVRDLDRDEGAAMHKHIFEEQLDWADLLALELPEGLDKPRGSNSREKLIQEEREKSALNALYISPSQIPDSPAEPHHQILEEEVDANVKHMLSGNDVRDLDDPERGMATTDQQHIPSVVQGLISQLANAGGLSLPNEASNQPPPVDLKSFGLNFDTLAQLAAHLPPQTQQPAQNSVPATNGYPAYSQPSQSYTNDQSWNTQYQDYGQQQQQSHYDDDGSSRSKWDESGGWRGRGRGGGKGRGGFRNTKRKLCNFFAQGRCRYGDQCDFLHEMP